MVINVHAGHNPDGKVACGCVSLLKESTEARNVKNEVIRQLQLLGHTVYDCTCDDGISQNDVLQKIVAKCNAHKVDLDVSIHFNSGANDKTGNGRSTGTEVYVYSKNAGATGYATAVVNSIAKLGFKNRGVKSDTGLYVLKKTNAPAMLIECCFVDDADDAKMYNVSDMASAIVFGLTGTKYIDPKPATKDTLYRVQVGAFSKRTNAENLRAELIGKGYNAFITQ